MPITLKFDATALLAQLMANFPESGECLTCIDWDYEKGTFEFWDHESRASNPHPAILIPEIKDIELTRSGLVKDAVVYTLNPVNLMRGLEVLLDMCIAGKLPGLSLKVGFADPANWDSWSHDALVQCAIFGDVVYG